MQATRFAMGSFLVLLNCTIAAERSDIRLVGIISRLGTNCAVLEHTYKNRIEPALVLAGGSIGDAKILTIDAASGEATIRRDGVEQKLLLSNVGVAAGDRLLQLEGAGVTTLLEVYQRLSDQTVLREPVLPESKITIVSQPKETLEGALAEIVAALAANNVILTNAGNIFALAVKGSQREKLNALPSPPAASSDRLARAIELSRSPKIAAHMIKLQELDLAQFRNFYEDLSQRTALYSSDLPFATYTVNNCAALSREEGIWMLETLFWLSDIAVLRHGKKFVVIVPPSRTNDVPASISDIGGGEILRSESVNLSGAELKVFLNLYASLAGKQPGEIAASIPSLRLTLRNRTAWTREEGIQAIDTFMAINHLAFFTNASSRVDLIPKANAP